MYRSNWAWIGVCMQNGYAMEGRQGIFMSGEGAEVRKMNYAGYLRVISHMSPAVTVFPDEVISA